MRLPGTKPGVPATALSIPVGGAGAPPGRAPPAGKPMRVMSLDMCTGQLVPALLPPGRIASVPWLAAARGRTDRSDGRDAGGAAIRFLG